MSIFTTLFDSNEKQINRLKPVVEKIKKKEEDYKDFDIQKIREEISQIRERLKEESKDKEDKESIQKIITNYIPQVFALTKLASKIATGLSHYDVQLMGGIELFEGRLIELATGEGKTFVATLPLALYSLLGKGAHLITVNDYLAKRDAEWCGFIYSALGISCGVITPQSAYKFIPTDELKDYKSEEEIENAPKVPILNKMSGLHLVECSKKEAYECDVTYSTNNEVGFDYLRDNMARTKSQIVQRDHLFCIVDEADSILIDESRTPLIISAPAEESSEMYAQFANVASTLTKDTDYIVDEKSHSVTLTEQGNSKVEKMLHKSNIYEDYSLAHHLDNALKAKELFHQDKDYLIKGGNIIIVDEFTGRLMEGRRFNEGIHQAIEAKEKVQIQQESRTLATITFQNYFRLYTVLSGMTGTALTEAEEFHKIYGLDVTAIPTNKPVIRKDFADIVFKTRNGKYNAVIEEIIEKNEKGQPVLVGTTSVQNSEMLSQLLSQKGVAHRVLNAKYHEKEAEIIQEAGKKNQVTIATNMAGRGTDISLGEGVKELGGLHVIGTERHEARRIDNQLRGRTGRQGDPGSSRFYVSLDDDIMRLFGGPMVQRIMSTLGVGENIPIESSIITRQIESAQKKVESANFDIRKNLVEYDDVLNIQREIYYKRRRQVIEKLDVESLDSLTDDAKEELFESNKELILKKVDKYIENIVNSKHIDNELEEESLDIVLEEFSNVFPKEMLDLVFKKINSSYEEWKKLLSTQKPILLDKVKEQLQIVAEEAYNFHREVISPKVFLQLSKDTILDTMDYLWMQHLSAVDELREGIFLRGYAQRTPLVEYKNEVYALFENLINSIDDEIVRRIFKVQIINVPQDIDLEKLTAQHEEIENLREGLSLIQEQTQKLPDQPISTDIQKLPQNIRAPQPMIMEKAKTRINDKRKIGRNDPCYCGSGKKYKKCHMLIDTQKEV